jgi:hypothetical protein
MRLGELSFGGSSEETATILPCDPTSAHAVMQRAQFMRRPGWSIRLASEFSWNNGGLRMNVTFEAFEGDQSVCQKAWDYEFPW